MILMHKRQCVTCTSGITVSILNLHVASQMWLLARLIPLMLGRYIPEKDPHWECYLLMLQVTELLFAPEISKDEVGYLGVLIRQHHEMFVEVYPNASVIPKMHFLIHTARLILL